MVKWGKSTRPLGTVIVKICGSIAEEITGEFCQKIAC